MTTDDRTRRGLGRPPLALIVLVLVLVVAAGAWSAFWVVASRKADAALTTWLAVEAGQGRVHSCDERRTGGYPFRFEFVCENPSLTLAAEPEIVATGAELRAVLQVWQPDHVIVELDGPLRVTSGPELLAGGTPFVADWDLMQASLLVPRGRLSAIDVASDGFTLRPEERDPEAPANFTLAAGHIELHQRNGTEPDARNAMDLAMSARDLVLTYPGADQAEPVDVNLLGSAVALTPDFLAHPRNFLPRWLEAGGSLSISAFEAKQDETSLLAQGSVRPVPEGQLEGDVTLAITGPDVASPGATQAFGGVAPFLATALQFVGEKTEVEGVPAMQGKLSLRDGKAFIGNFPIAELPPLF